MKILVFNRYIHYIPYIIPTKYFKGSTCKQCFVTFYVIKLFKLNSRIIITYLSTIHDVFLIAYNLFSAL